MKRLPLSTAVRPLAEYVADSRDETPVLTEGDRAWDYCPFTRRLRRGPDHFASRDEGRVLPKRSPNKRMQPTARRTRRG